MTRLSERTPSTINNHQLSIVALTMTLLFSIGHATAGQVIVTPDDDWSAAKKENRTNDNADGPITCESNKVMIGRQHDGDENGNTQHKCASVKQNDTVLTVGPKSTHDISKESTEYKFECPDNKVLVGRGHQGDENGSTKYYCAQVMSAGNNPLQVGNRTWSADIKESGSDYTCPSGQVMAGRGHKGDENGATWYQCAMLE